MKKTITIENRKARHDYFVLETLICGIELRGNEVKSIRSGMCNINNAWIDIKNNELFIKNMHITKYDTANTFDVDVLRDRRLLVHKREILKLAQKVKEQGITLIPLEVFFDKQYCKVELGICKGKHNYDKRQTLKEKQTNREIDRTLKAKNNAGSL